MLRYFSNSVIYKFVAFLSFSLLHSHLAFGEDVTREFSLDNKSNLISDQHDNTVIDYQYGAHNRLTRVTTGTQVIEYAYNALGQRVIKTVKTGNHADVTHYIYGPSGELIAESHNSEVVQYYYIEGVPVAQFDAVKQELYYIHSDHLGAPRLLTDKNKNIVWQAEYNPFGQAKITLQKVQHNLRLPGQYYDKETGLHYNGRRYYDPTLGRYINGDPVGLLYDYSDPQIQVAIEVGIPLDSGDNSHINHPYVYAKNNPLTNVDPTGLDSLRASLLQAIARGNTRQIKSLMDALSDPKLRKAAQDALNKFGSRADDWIARNCKGSINREFPQSLRNKTLEEIRHGNSKEYRKAWKLLNDKRFQK